MEKKKEELMKKIDLLREKFVIINKGPEKTVILL